MDSHQIFGFLLHDVTRLYQRRFEQRSAQFSLTLPQCKTLSLLARNEGISQRQLADPESTLTFFRRALGLRRERAEFGVHVTNGDEPDGRQNRAVQGGCGAVCRCVGASGHACTDYCDTETVGHVFSFEGSRNFNGALQSGALH